MTNKIDKDKEQLIKKIALLGKQLEELKGVESKYRETEAELNIQAWGLKKTNEAIKLLYKELEEKNRKLQRLDQLKSDFVSTVSHELRTPLAIIKEGIELVIDGIPGDINERQKNVLVISRDNINRLSRIINELLDIAKIEAGRIDLKKRQIDINELIRSFIAPFEAKVKEKGLEFKTDLPKDEVNIYIDPDRIIQVFTNLLYNAIKFTKRGFIRLSVKDKKNEVECSVSDTGIGISETDMPKVFNKFQQFGRIPGAGDKGTGLGLSIVKGVVELHKGKVWLESKLGQGSKFIFTLPKSSERLLLKEYIDTAIKKASENNLKVSFVFVSFKDLNKIKLDMPEEKIEAFLKDLAGLLKNSLRHHSEVYPMKSEGRIVIILVDCDKEGALKVTDRIKQTLSAYLSYEKLEEKIKLRFDNVTYPDEATNSQKVIEKGMIRV